MQQENICPFCQYAVPQKNSGCGLVDCVRKGYGNAHQTECESFQENSRITKLKDATVEAIREFDEVREGSNGIAGTKLKAMASRCVALQEAFAIMVDIGYDHAAEMLRSLAERQKGGTKCKNEK